MKTGRKRILLFIIILSLLFTLLFTTSASFAYESHCYRCDSYISDGTCVECPECGWYICNRCGACGCGYVEYPHGSDNSEALLFYIAAFVVLLLFLVPFVLFVFDSIRGFIYTHILKPSKNKQLPSSSSEPIVFTKTHSPTPSPKPMSPSVSSFPRQQNKYVFERYTGKFIGTLIKEDPLYVYIETSNSTRFRCLKDLFARKYELRKYKYTYYDSYDYTYHRNSRWSDRGWSREVNEEYYRMLNSDSDSDSD